MVCNITKQQTSKQFYKEQYLSNIMITEIFKYQNESNEKLKDITFPYTIKQP